MENESLQMTQPDMPTITIQWSEEHQAPRIQVTGFKNQTFVRSILETCARWAENQEKLAMQAAQMEQMQNEALKAQIIHGNNTIHQGR